MIEVYARQERKNPQQKAIVNSKDLINRRTSKLITLLIALKKGWNGGPSPDLGVDKFNLTQPIPDVIPTTGDSAVQELSDIIQTLRQIKALQDNYSVSRTQRADKLKQVQEQAPTPVVPSNDNAQQVAAAAVVDEFLKTASNPLTRIWTYITAYNPFVSEKNRGQRLYLLKSLARIDKNLRDIEDNVLTMGESSLLDSIYIAKQLYSDAKSSFFGEFRKNIEEMLVSTNNQLETLKEELKKKPEKVKPLIYSTQRKVILEGIDDAQSVINEPLPEAVPKTKDDKPPLSDKPIKLPSEEDLKKELSKEPSPEVAAEPEKASTPSRRVSPGRTRRKRKIPVAPVPEAPKSEFIDSDFEQAQYENRYREIAKYLYGNVDALIRESHDVILSNLAEPWGSRVKQEYRTAYKLGELMVSKIRNGEDYEFDYLEFLKSVGAIKSIEYMASVQPPDVTTINEGDVNSQADNFAKAEFSKYRDITTAKISQASTSASRFIKRMITHIIPRRDRNLRLMISRNIRQARNGLQGMMDTLEDRHLNFRRLSATSELFYDSLINCYEALADLADMYNSSMRIEKAYRKQKHDRMPYDLIPTLDINALRMMQRYLETDRMGIQKLHELEGSITETSNTLEGKNE